MSDNSRVRVAIVGVIVIALFGALVARLWFMQMGGEEQLKFQAVARATRTVQTESPRGRILDRNGTVLVENVAEWAVTVDRQLAKSTRTRVLGQLAEVLAPQYTAEQLENNFNDLRQTPLKPAIVAVGVPEPARIAILEHIEDYPGTHVEKLTVRHYPHGELAAHVLGYTGEISEAQLATRRDAGYQEGDAIGKDGAERAFEKELRGQPRREKVEVDPTGAPVGNPLDVQPGTIGDDVALTIDANWQYAAETALAQGIASARDAAEREHQEQALREAEGAGGRGRRDGRHRRLDRRDGVVPELRRQLVRRRHQPDRVEGAERQPRPPAGRPRDPGRVRAGLHLQAGQLDRDDAVRDPRAERHGPRQGVRRARQGQAPVQERRSGCARTGPAAERDHPLERRVLLHGRRRVLAGLEQR